MPDHALTIEQWPIERLVPYVGNARRHSPAQVAQIAASIAEFGFVAPCIVDATGSLVAGHGRLEAARKLGMPKVPVIQLAPLTEDQIKALRIADNKIAENAIWDDGLLSLELKALQAVDFDLGLLGFTVRELEQLMGPGEGLANPESVPELPVRPVSVLGDVWCLGAHRLLCGDATKPEDVSKAMGGLKPHLLVSDPPYGVSYDPAWRNTAGVSRTRRTGKVRNDDRADWRDALALFSGSVAYIWHGGLFAGVVAESLESLGFVIRSQIVWAKERLVLSRGDFHWMHEPCYYAVRAKSASHWSGDRSQTTLWNIASGNQDADTVHATQKPLECMRRPIENNSAPGDAVYDPFLGSGTTLIAAEQIRRHCCAIEIDPAYVDVSVLRWQDFTGQDAVHEATGQSYSARAAALNRNA